MPEVLEIESQCFEFPWNHDTFIRCLRQRNCIGMVAENENEKIVGFMIYELHKDHLHVLDFAVHELFRRHGVGTALVGNLVKKLSFRRRTEITLAVCETNLAAQQFFSAVGFLAIEVLPDFYDDIEEDAYLFRRRVKRDIEQLATVRER